MVDRNEDAVAGLWSDDLSSGEGAKSGEGEGVSCQMEAGGAEGAPGAILNTDGGVDVSAD